MSCYTFIIVYLIFTWKQSPLWVFFFTLISLNDTNLPFQSMIRARVALLRFKFAYKIYKNFLKYI